MNPMYNPPHPGLILRNDILPALGLTVTDAAEQLGVTRSDDGLDQGMRRNDAFCLVIGGR